MNEEHVIAAILTAGLLARKTDDELAPKDVITLYEMVLASYLTSIRPTK
ncbi:MAG: hypothetical protein HW386_702 [Gammaproteobacteria bacterium]|nr:hypothetical protein [Gammaproteobacteria bacterium]